MGPNFVTTRAQSAAAVLGGGQGVAHSVQFEQKHETERAGVLVAMRAVAVKHPDGNHHKRLAVIEGEWVSANDGARNTEELQLLALQALDTAIAVAANPPPAPAQVLEPAPDAEPKTESETAPAPDAAPPA
jgi:hypothetical protein